LYGIGLGAVAVCWALVQYQDVIQGLLVVSGVALLGYVLYESFKLDKEPRERMFAILFLISLNPLFWGLFEQAGGSMNLFTDRFVDRGGVPAAIFQSINPIIIMLCAPLFAGLWVWLGKRAVSLRHRPNSVWHCCRWALPILCSYGARKPLVSRDDAGHPRLCLLSAGNNCGALPVAGRAVGDEPARAEIFSPRSSWAHGST
jgi:hypothetical protein